MSNKSYNDSFINFSKVLENDKEELARLDDMLNTAIRERNTISTMEFKKFEPIFKLSGRDILGNEDYDELCREYFKRVSPYHPVYIVDNEGTVVLTLPAIFNSVACVSDAGPAGCNAIDAFTNANEAADEFNVKKKTYTGYLSQIFDAVQDPETLQRRREEAAKHVEDFKALASNNTSSSDGEIIPYKPEEVNDINQGLSDEVEYL